MTASAEQHAELAAVGPYETAIGSALITMVEPHIGHDRAYNRWYEDDHFFSGAMAMPWIFSGRRWVAPTWLQALRHPRDSAVAEPLEAGKYISTYWITEGRYDDHLRWTVATNKRLLPDGRINQDRTHVYTSFQRYRGASYRDATGPRDIHALEYPYGGLVVEVIDAGVAGRDELVRWLKHDRSEQVLAPGSPVSMLLVFEPMPLPDDKMAYVKDVEGVDRRVTALWFCDGDPRDVWAPVFAGSGAAVDAAGVGRVELGAPFIPTIPGTDTYVADLR